MHTDDRREHPDSSLAPRSRCLASSYCQLPVSIARHCSGLDGLWLHLGPIAPQTTPLTFHRAERAPSAANAGRLEVATRAPHRRCAGYSVDLFGLEHAPGGGARRYVQSVSDSRQALWVVYAVAWGSPDGVSVDWRAPGFGFQHEGYNINLGTAVPSSAVYQEADRLFSLLADGKRRRGRPSRWEHPAWREIGLRAIERKDASPGLTWNVISDAEGVPVSTLRDWIRILREERTHGIRVLSGGDE